MMNLIQLTPGLRTAPVFVRAWLALSGLLTVTSCATPLAPGHYQPLTSIDGALRFDPHLGRWGWTPRGDLEDGDEVLSEGWLFEVDGQQLLRVAEAQLEDLSPASQEWDSTGQASTPGLGDWVLALTPDLHHARLGDLKPGARVAYGGRVFETQGDASITAVRASGEVVTSVMDWMVRRSESGTIRVQLQAADGEPQVLVSTAEHPFYLPQEGRYVLLEEIELGDELLLQGGRSAWVTGIEVLSGAETVYNFEVNGTHNYFVRAEGWEGEGVLVHNAERCKRVRVTAEALRSLLRGQSVAPDSLTKGLHYTLPGGIEVEIFAGSKGELVFDYVLGKSRRLDENSNVAPRIVELALKNEKFRKKWS